MTQPIKPFRQTHKAPASGMATWPHPGSATNGPRLDPDLPVQVVRVYGEWAQVECSNGWTTWVDGPALLPVVPPANVRTAAAPSPRAPVASPGPYKFVTPTKATWPVSAGAALVVVATLLPWIDAGGAAQAVNALDVPLVFLLDWKRFADGGLSLGVVLLVFAAAAFTLRHLSGLEKLARVPGVLCVPAIFMFLVQVNSNVNAAKNAGDQNVSSLFDVVGIGVWLALIGAGLLSWGGTRA